MNRGIAPGKTEPKASRGGACLVSRPAAEHRLPQNPAFVRMRAELVRRGLLENRGGSFRLTADGHALVGRLVASLRQHQREASK